MFNRTWFKNNAWNLGWVLIVVICAYINLVSYPIDLFDGNETVRLLAWLAFFGISGFLCYRFWNGTPVSRLIWSVIIACTFLINGFLSKTVKPEYRQNQAIVAAAEANANKPWGTAAKAQEVDETPYDYEFGHELSPLIPSDKGFPDNVDVKFEIQTPGVRYKVYGVDDYGNMKLLGEKLPLGDPNRQEIAGIGNVRFLRVQLPPDEPAKKAIFRARVVKKTK